MRSDASVSGLQGRPFYTGGSIRDILESWLPPFVFIGGSKERLPVERSCFYGRNIVVLTAVLRIVVMR